MGQSLREKLACEADIPDRAIRPLLQLYHEQAVSGRSVSMDTFVARVKKAKK